MQNIPLADEGEEDLELIGDTSDEEAVPTKSQSSSRHKKFATNNMPESECARTEIAHEYFADKFPSPLGKYFIDEVGRKVYTNTSGYHFYFEKNEDGVYPVTVIPSKFDNPQRRYVGGPLGFSIGSGCFRRGTGGD